MTNNKNNKILYPRGSEWRKWDFHVHTPSSYINSFKGWDSYVKKLNEITKRKDIKVLGITDYFSIDGYKEIISKYRDKLENVEFMLPNIEFRLDNIVYRRGNKEPKRLNFHVIFSNEIKIDHIESQFIGDLHFYKGSGDVGELSKIKFEKSAIEKYGKECKKQEDFKNDSDLEAGVKNIVFKLGEIIDTLKNKPDYFKGKYLFFLESEFWSEIDWGQDYGLRKTLLQLSHGIFDSNPNDIKWFLGRDTDSYSNQQKFIDEFGRLFPCVHGSDAHSEEELESRPDLDRYCWIKADPTFEGLKQILYEPKDRIFIGRENPALFRHAVIDSFNTSNENEKFFLKKIGNIYFNPGLNCVIGSRGSGKSTLLDAAALSLGDVDVLDEKRNNYIGFFFRRNDRDIINAKVRHSSAGEIKELSPNTAKDSGFLFDYYYQKQIGYFADPNNEDKLSRFLFEKIFQEDTGVSSLFDELGEQRDTFASKLAVNREKVVACEKEISKEEEVQNKIKDKNSRAKFLTQPAIKDLLAKRNKIIELRERIKRIKDRLENIEEEPLISDKDAVDTKFFSELLLSEVDPEGTVLPKEWKDLEKEASSFLESLGANKEELKKQIATLTAKIIELEPSFNFNERLNAIWEDIKTESAKQNLTITKDDLGKLDSIQKDILTLEEQLEDIKKRKGEKQTLLGERKCLLDGYIGYLNSVKEKLGESFRKLLEGDGAILNDTIKLEIETVSPIDSYLVCIQEKAVHDSEDDLPNFPNRKPLLELFKQLGSDKLIISFRSNNFGDWNVRGLGMKSLDYFKKIKNKEEVVMHLEELLPELTSRLLWRPDLTKEFKPLKNCSIGERGTALLSIILIAGVEPLIIDQPEDDLDHFYLYKTLTPIIKEVKKKRQLIFATHDANIVVNGDAELISIVTTDDGEFGDIILTSIENLTTREKVMDVLEGGEAAFIRREQKYGFK